MACRDPEEGKRLGRERWHRKIEARRAAGLCERCGKCPPADGRIHCDPCAEKCRTYQRARVAWLKAEGKYSEDQKKRRKTQQRCYYRKKAERIARGICMECGRKPAVPDRRLCRDCGEKSRARYKARYARAREQEIILGHGNVENRRRYSKEYFAKRYRERI